MSYITFFVSPERFFEDHESVVEVLSDWTRDTENKILFLEKREKYALFKNPQVSGRGSWIIMSFYLCTVYYILNLLSALSALS